jgi:hypothetical protein
MTSGQSTHATTGLDELPIGLGALAVWAAGALLAARSPYRPGTPDRSPRYNAMPRIT